MIRARLLFILLIIFLSQTLSASSVRVNSTGAAKGTFNLCAIRDKYGFLWVGTTTGLACFDGNGKPTNNTPSGILRSTSNMRVTNIFEYGDNLLFATPNRLMKFDRSKKTTYRIPLRTKYGVEISSPVSNICNGLNDGDIWIATQGQGIFRYDAAKDELIQNTRHGSFFTDIILSDDGIIYAAENNGDIHKYKNSGEYISTSHIPGYIPNKAIINLVQNGNNIWVTVGNNIFCLDTLSDSIALKNSTPAAISSIIKYDDNRLVLGTASGVMEYNTSANSLSTFEVAENERNINSNSINVKINHLTKNKNSDGILTVRQSGEIVELFTLDNKYRFVPVSNEFAQNKFVNVLTVDNRNNGLWVGSDNGLFYYDNATGKLSSTNIPGLGNESITSITTDDKQVLIGTASNGLFIYNTATGSSQHFKNDDDIPYSLLSDEINNVFVTTQGVTYVLTHWGICRYNPLRNEFNTLPEVGQQTEVLSMAEYYDGALWASTVKDGLLYLKPGDSRFINFNSPNLANITVNKLIMSRGGTLWATTQSDGLYFFNKDINDFEKYKLPFLSNASILALQEDDNGTLWILTEESIIKISNDGHAEANYRNVLSPMAMALPFALLENGDMAIGGNNGFHIFNTSLLSQDNNVATYPTTISFPDSDSDETVEQLGLNILLYTTDKITLPYNHNSFTLHLAANHTSDVPSVNYDYMLEGVDKSWNIGTSQSEVTYNNLSPGTYRFMVRPSGFSDVETNALTITVSPPWYLTMWAYIAYAVLLLLIATAVWQLVRMRVRKYYARRLESLKIQREREAWESKMHFFVDLVHEIRTPLMLISLPLEQLLKRFKTLTSDSKKLEDKDFINRELSFEKKYLGSMQTNLDYLLGITNELLDFRKVDNENANELYLTSSNLNLLIEEIRDRFEEPMETEQKKLYVSLPDKPVIADVDKVKIDRVLMNLIGNARKYCKTVTEIKLEEENGNVVITISDDGPGIPKDERNRVFNLYYQIKGDFIATAIGTGLGLAYARMIVRSHGGEISVDQSQYGGACFKINIPLVNASASRAGEEAKEIYSDKNAVVDKVNVNRASSEDNGENKNPEETYTVMIVDDNKELLEMICDGLDGRYNIITASDGIDALEKLKDNDVDFIVSDVMMPRMNGMELLQKVKDDINTSHIPFIILTAKTTRESREEGMEFGADVYLEKPFSIRALIFQIENIRRTREYFYARRRGTEPLASIEAAEKEAIEENKLPSMSKYDRDFLERMEKLMEENVSDEEFTIDILAENLNMSRSSFYRKVKVLMGMTPVDYIKNYRLDMAAQQLREHVRVNEVAANVGFTSHSYFAKCFKEKYGVLPRDFVASSTQ